MGSMTEGYRTAQRRVERNGQLVTISLRHPFNGGPIEILDGTAWREAKPGEVPPPSGPLPQVNTEWVR